MSQKAHCSTYLRDSAQRPTKLSALVKASSTGTSELVKWTSNSYVPHHAKRKKTKAGRYVRRGMWLIGKSPLMVFCFPNFQKYQPYTAANK